MNKLSKKIPAIMLTLVLSLSLLPISGLADDVSSGEATPAAAAVTEDKSGSPETPAAEEPKSAGAAEQAPAVTVSIADDILNTGCLNAVVSNDAGGAVYTYKWFVKNGGAWRSVDDDPYYNGANALKDTSGNALVNSEATLYVAADGAQQTYKVELYSGAELAAASGEYTVSYFDSLQNGDFENTAVSGSFMHQYANGAPGLCWQTTGVGTGNMKGHDIEIIRPENNMAGAMNAYHSNDIPSGRQCAELNCEAWGALYEDVLTTPGETLYWGLSHRARSSAAGDSGIDTMAVIISGTAAVKGTFNPANDTTLAVGGDVQAIISDNNSNWYNYTNSAAAAAGSSNVTKVEGSDGYTVPAGQYVTRFYFVSVDAAKNSTCGNLLDNITFSKSIPTFPERSIYVINYYLDGVLQTADTQTGHATVGDTIYGFAANKGHYSACTDSTAAAAKTQKLAADSALNVIDLSYVTGSSEPAVSDDTPAAPAGTPQSGDTPAAQTPAVDPGTPAVDIADPRTPTVDIADPLVPAAEIADPEVPMADASVQITGDELVLWIALAIAAAAALVYVVIISKRKNDADK